MIHMRLVFIYGPPAVGKLTVARRLAAMTGFKIFHNHASLDFVNTVFPFGTPTFSRLVVKFRMEMLEAAAKEGIDVIFTSAYVMGDKLGPTLRLIRSIEKHGGKVCFVRLYCDRAELMRRVRGRSRLGYNKIRAPKELERLLAKGDFFAAMPIGGMSIDNTDVSPGDAARMIVRHYGIETRRRAKAR